MNPLRFARIVVASALLASAALLPQGCATPAKSPAPTAASMQSLATFDAAWQIVRDEHFDADTNGVDWNAVRDELRPRAASARSRDELRGVLMDMLSRLGQSHFTIIPADVAADEPLAVADASDAARPTEASAASRLDDGLAGAVAPADTPGIEASVAPVPSADTPGLTGIDIVLVESAPTVLRVSPGLPGAAAGVLVGWRLVSVDGVRVDALLEPARRALAEEKDANSPRARELRARLAFLGGELLAGRAGERRQLVFLDASEGEQQVAITLAEAPFGTTKFGNLPAFPVEVESRIVEIPAEPGVSGAKPVRIGLLSFNIWMTGASDAIDRAVDQMRGCDGIVVDLRGNPGGMGAMSMGLAGHFLREPTSLGSMIGRDSTLEFRALPRKVSAEGKRVRPYATKPLAIVIDGRSASTSELFAAGLQELGRARVFGENSAGMALPAQAKELPNGDVLLHAVADFVTPKGTRIEGRGVTPDESVALSRAQLLRGEDAALGAATGWIARETAQTRAARANPPASAMPVAMPAPVP